MKYQGSHVRGVGFVVSVLGLSVSVWYKAPVLVVSASVCYNIPSLIFNPYIGTFFRGLRGALYGGISWFRALLYGRRV